MSKKNFKLSVEIENNVTNLSEAEQYIDSLEQMGLNIDHLRKRSAQLVDTWDDLTPRKRTQQIRRLRKTIASTAAGTLDLKKETADLAKTNKKTTASTNQLRKSSSKLDKTYGKLRNRIAAVGGALLTYFSIKKITNFFTSAISGAAGLEEQLDKVQAVSGATNQEMQRIAETAEKLGGSTKYTATQAAQGFEILARAGLSANESITAIPAVLDLANAAGIELAEAASYITKSVAGMNLSMTDSGRVADVLAKAAASANTDVGGLGQALSYAAPSAAALGLSLEETVAIIGKFADAGIDASRAGTALNSIMAQFANPASKFRQELSAIGINTNDFSKALRALAKAGDKGQKAILAVGQEAGPALKALLAQGIPALNELIQKLREVQGSAGSMAGVMNDNLKGALTGLSSRWQTLKDTLGKPFLIPITERVKQLSDIIKGFVDSGKIEQLGQVFAAEFDKMLGKALAFIREFNLDEVSRSINDFTTNFTDKFKTIEAVFGTVYNTLATGFNTIKSIIFGVASVVADASAVIANANAKLLEMIPGMEQAAINMREHAGGMAAVADEFGQRAAKAFDDATAAANRFNEHTAALTQTTTESTEALKQKNNSLDAQSELIHHLNVKIKALQQREAEYIAAGKKGTTEHNLAIKNRINLQIELAEKTEEINRRETEIFNQKSAQLNELRKQEAAFTVKTAADAKAYEALVNRRIALEKQLEAITKNKIILTYKEADAAKQLAAARTQAAAAAKQSAAAGSEAAVATNNEASVAQESTQATETKAQATRNATQATQDATKATKENAEALKETNKAFGKTMSFVEMVRLKYAELPAAAEAFDKVMESAIKGHYVLGFLADAEAAATLAIEKHAEATKRAADVSAELNDKISDNTLSMQDIESATGFATEAMEVLNEAELKDLNDSIDAARQKLQSLEDKAKETAAAVADRLADATGDASDKINRRFQREIDNIRKQQAQANGIGSEHYAKAIADLEKLKKIELKKQHEREQQAEKRKIEAEKKAAERQRKSDERKHSSATTSPPNQTADERAKAYRNNASGAAGGNTVVLQLGNEKINIDGVTDEVIRRIDQHLRQYQKGRGR